MPFVKYMLNNTHELFQIFDTHFTSSRCNKPSKPEASGLFVLTSVLIFSAKHLSERGNQCMYWVKIILVCNITLIFS